MNKKQQVLTELFKICKKRNNYVFHNDLVKKVSQKVGFGNPFDATKIDNKNKLPQILLDNDFAVIHLGKGKHQFIKGINKVYHDFEPIQETIQWTYKKSLLNEYNSSESNILSVANNQRILHHFLFGKDTELDSIDITLRPKTYFPHRTKTRFTYYFGKDLLIELEKIQIEIDLTIEFQGTIGIFECKNKKPDNFSVYQICRPFSYYFNANGKTELRGKIREMLCYYVLREKSKAHKTLRLLTYAFANSFGLTTIKFKIINMGFFLRVELCAKSPYFAKHLTLQHLNQIKLSA